VYHATPPLTADFLTIPHPARAGFNETSKKDRLENRLTLATNRNYACHNLPGTHGRGLFENQQSLRGEMMKVKLIFAFLALVATIFAQGERGSLNGTVTDQSGAVVPNATVRVLNINTGVETNVVTNDAGVWRVPYLQPGTYRITVTAQGFRGATRDNVILAVAQTLTVDFSLEVGQVSDTVTISSEPPLIETGSAEIGSYVTKKEFDTWPITVGDGRRQIQQFIFTSLPGTVGGTFQGSINGGQNYTHEILLDGMPLGRFDLQGGSNNEFSPSAEAISEMKLQTGTVSAQYSGGQTAVANFATKSGTNELHGSAYYYHQNDAFRANGWGNNAAGIRRQPFKQHNYGYSAGGPVILPKIYNGKNKSFWFHNLEKTRVRDFVSTTFSTLPTMDFRRGDFSRLFNSAFTGNARSGTMVGTDAAGRSVQFGAIYDPTTTRVVNGRAVRDPFPGNIIPQNRWSPVARNVLEVAKIDEPLFDTMLNNIPAIGTCCPFFDETMLTLKGDHYLNSSHKFTGMFNRNFRERNNSPGGRWGVPPGLPTNVYQLQNTPGTAARFAYDWTVKANLLNRLAIGYNRFGNINESVYVDQDWPQKIGLQNVPGVHFPGLLFGGQPFQGGGIGAGGRLGSSARGGSYNGSTIIQDDMTWIRGKHNVKFGFEQRRYYSNQRIKSGSGEFNFNPIQTAQIGFNNETGHSFASFLLGAVQSTSRAVAVTNFGYRQRQTGFYLMDDWKMTRKLTLNLGLRWEIIGGLQEVAGRMSGLGLVPNPGAANRIGALQFVDDLGRKGFMDTYWWQLSPKFGFAYAVNEKFVFRGGYGINNSPPVLNFGAAGGQLGFNGAIDRNAGNTQLAFNEDPVMYLHQPYPSFTATLPNKNPALSNGLGISYYARDNTRLPYVQNWNFGFQYQLPASTVLEVNYIGNTGRRINARGLDSLNQPTMDNLRLGNALLDPWTPASGIPAPFPGFSGTILQALRPFPQFTGVGQPFAYFGFSNYNGLQTQVTRHFKNGLAILFAYTWSKALGFTDGAIDTETAADVYNRSLERSITSYSFPHFVKATWIYELPIGPNKALRVPGIAGKIVGGWQLSGIHNARSGAPLGIGTAAAVNPFGASRPDQVLGQTIISNSSAPINFRGVNGGQTYLNRAAFTDPAVAPGGRNIMTRLGTVGPLLPNIRGPMFHSHDMSLQKMFKFTEQKSFEVRVTALNVINRAGRGNPVTSLANPFFGQIIGAQVGGRNIELSGRFTF
jgi:hypothetical protein